MLGSMGWCQETKTTGGEVPGERGIVPANDLATLQKDQDHPMGVLAGLPYTTYRLPLGTPWMVQGCLPLSSLYGSKYLLKR